MIVPFVDVDQRPERKLGLLDGQTAISFADDFKMTEEELLGLR